MTLQCGKKTTQLLVLVINALKQHHVEGAIIKTIGEHKSRSRMRCTLIIRQKSAQNVRESVILTNETEV